MLNIGISRKKAAQPITRVSRKIRGNSGLALVWTGIVAFATFLLIALATSVLMMTSSATQIDQIAEYWADTALREYIGTYGDKRGAYKDENKRREKALEEGLTHAITMANRVLNKGATVDEVAVKAMVTGTQWGTWDYQMWQGGAGLPIDFYFQAGGPTNDRCRNNLTGGSAHENCNALVIRMTMNINRSFLASLFFISNPDPTAGKIVGISVKAMAAYDERLLQDGLFPYIVRLRYEP